MQLGDDYAGEATMVERLRIEPAQKERLIAAYNDRAADCYSRVVTRYPMAPHVEDAREKLISLGRPVPEPSQTALAESEAEEQSRINVKLKDRAIMLVKHGPTTLEAARVGEPLMTPPKTVTAPDVNKQNAQIFETSMAKGATAAPAATPSAAVANGTAAPRTGDAAPPRIESVPEGNGTGIGAEVLNPSGNAIDNNNGNSSTGAAPPAAASTDPTAPAPAGSADNYGLKAVGPANAAPLPPVAKPAEAQDQVNDVKGAQASAQVQTGTPAPTTKRKKNPKVKTDQSSESSSTNKKKKGLDKLNPF
jgi:outer membrane protein assembly factor BamD